MGLRIDPSFQTQPLSPVNHHRALPIAIPTPYPHSGAARALVTWVKLAMEGPPGRVGPWSETGLPHDHRLCQVHAGRGTRTGGGSAAIPHQEETPGGHSGGETLPRPPGRSNPAGASSRRPTPQAPQEGQRLGGQGNGNVHRGGTTGLPTRTAARSPEHRAMATETRTGLHQR